MHDSLGYLANGIAALAGIVLLLEPVPGYLARRNSRSRRPTLLGDGQAVPAFVAVAPVPHPPDAHGLGGRPMGSDPR
jgi:hypothetical protein